jgi:hypothetical protein
VTKKVVFVRFRAPFHLKQLLMLNICSVLTITATGAVIVVDSLYHYSYNLCSSCCVV